MSIRYYNNDHTLKAEKYVGQVLCLGEHNYYDDSYFYALVFVPETGELKEIEYDATAYGDSLMSADRDITPENLAAYRSYRENLERKIALAKKQHWHDQRAKIRNNAGITFKQVELLADRYGWDNWCFDAIINILSTKDFRSEFRKNIAEQVRNWLADESPEYKYPLSPRQIECINGRHTPKAYTPYIGGSIIDKYPNI